MDILAHGLWAAAAGRGLRLRNATRLSLGWMAWWGVFPDLFAFTIPVTLRLWQRLTDPAATAVRGPAGMPRLELAWRLYQISHSLLVWAAVFALVWYFRRPRLELLAWGLHIVMDIPSHTLRFFATPFLWPVSDYRYDGISWGNRWFMLANYSALAAVHLALWLARRRARPEVREPAVR